MRAGECGENKGKGKRARKRVGKDEERCMKEERLGG